MSEPGPAGGGSSGGPEQSGARIHPTADVADSAELGVGTSVWNFTKVRENARIGTNCNVGQGVYIGRDVTIGDNVKIQNNAHVFEGATVESGVFIGPGAILTNDVWPRAITPEGDLKTEADWELGSIRVCYGASIGAGAILLPNLVIGRFALVAAGAVVTRDVSEHALVVGNPARRVGFVCRCARKLREADAGSYVCPACDETYRFSEAGGATKAPTRE